MPIFSESPVQPPTEVWFREYVERRGGVFFGRFTFPMDTEDMARYWTYKAPPGMLMHSALWERKCEMLYALPAKPGKMDAVALVPIVQYDTSPKKAAV